MNLSHYNFVYILIIGLFTGILFVTSKKPSVVITKFICESMDRAYFIVKNVTLSKDANGDSVMNAQVQPLKNLENVLIKIVMMRKVRESYQPYFVEATLNFCDFLKDHKNQIPWSIFYQRLLVFTNMNHTCPYNHDLILKDFKIVIGDFNLVPLPKGQYAFAMKFFVEKILKFKSSIQFFCSSTIVRGKEEQNLLVIAPWPPQKLIMVK
ncbi:uncharacterized protein LOC142235296 [Haematobia irritans]|uniref:uncharacterized protein LOC142235296 n=1 Tax=Haematobia irritans TaxID=7368 RepID=UPI003F5089C1